MYLKRFGFPSYSEEKGYLFNCDTGEESVTPFSIFPQRNLANIDFAGVTIFCGSSDSEKNLVLDLIACKLGIIECVDGLNENLINGYLGMCYTRYAEYIEKRSDVDKIYISREQALKHIAENKYRFDGNNTLLHFYESRMKGKTICLIQEPETGMSLEEIMALTCLIEDFSVYSKTQFIISTNSALLLGIKDALIYNFDDRIIMGRTWYNSSKAAKYVSFYRELIQKHRQ